MFLKPAYFCFSRTSDDPPFPKHQGDQQDGPEARAPSTTEIRLKRYLSLDKTAGSVIVAFSSSFLLFLLPL